MTYYLIVAPYSGGGVFGEHYIHETDYVGICYWNWKNEYHNTLYNSKRKDLTIIISMANLTDLSSVKEIVRLHNWRIREQLLSPTVDCMGIMICITQS